MVSAMTQHQALRVEPDSPTAYFVCHGNSYVPTWIAQGPWGQSIAGQVVGGLLAWSLESDAGDPELQPARLTVDLLRPVALEPVEVETGIERQGRRIRLADAVLTQRGNVVARASALFLRRGEQPPGEVWSTSVAMPPLPTEPDEIPDTMPMLIHTFGWGAASTTPDPKHPEYQNTFGPKFAWLREARPLIDGEPLTPFTRAAMAGDVTSSLTHWGTDGLRFINADYTLTLSRLPEGPYLGLAALTHHSHDGVASGTATISDHRGPIGTGVATAVVNPGFRSPFQ
jgi:acyl-coenzyme A thioesterase PaaI-like protein